MRLIRWLILLPFAAIVISFAVSNLETVNLRLWPFDFIVAAPLYLFVFLVALPAFFLGALIAWWSGLGARREGRRRAGEIARLEGEVAALRRELAAHERRAPPPAAAESSAVTAEVTRRP